MPCGTRVTEPGVLGLEQHGGQSYGLYFIFLAFMYVLRCISLNINSQQLGIEVLLLTRRDKVLLQV